MDVTAKIITQFIRDLSFENPHGLESFKPGSDRPLINANVDVKAKKRTPLAMLVPQEDQEWINYVNHWIEIKKARGFFEDLKNKWKI